MAKQYKTRRDVKDNYFNLNLREARRRTGYTMNSLAKATGLPRPNLYAYERMRMYPTKENADRIASALNKPAEELFPEALRKITREIRIQRDWESGKKIRSAILEIEKKINYGMATMEDRVRLSRLYSLQQPQRFESLQDYDLKTSRTTVEDEVSHSLLKETIKEVLCTLSDPEKYILMMSFGVGDIKECNEEEIAKRFHISEESIRHIESKAIRKLQHPHRSGRLEGFLEAS